MLRRDVRELKVHWAPAVAATSCHAGEACREDVVKAALADRVGAEEPVVRQVRRVVEIDRERPDREQLPVPVGEPLAILPLAALPPVSRGSDSGDFVK